MKFTATFVAAASLFGSALSQGNTTNGTDFATGLVAALNGANLTILATLLQGQPALAGALQTGNYSVFAPTNAALTAFVGNQSLSSINQSVITQILQYHVTPAAVRQSALSANHTIVPSLLQAPLLGANTTHPIVAYVAATGPVVLTAAANVPIGANVTYRNLLVHVVNGVLTPPQNLTTSLALANLTSLAGAAQSLGAATVGALSSTPRITVFAPNNAAFANLSSTIAQLNATQITNVLLNHIINGTVVYSPNISATTTASSARGQTFRFMMSNGTTLVMSGNTTAARIIRPDIPIANGVLHVIDGILANTA